jgi:hypothetical protein
LGEIIDTYKKSQYNSLLEELGCRESDMIEDLNCIIDVADVLVKNSEARNMLYAYLKSKRNMIMEQGLYEKVKQLPIFPVKTKNGVEYVPYSKNIYTHDYKVSDNEFKILDTSIMGYERACEILSSEDRINKLTDEVYENKYWDYLINYIKSES